MTIRPGTWLLDGGIVVFNMPDGTVQEVEVTQVPRIGECIQWPNCERMIVIDVREERGSIYVDVILSTDWPNPELHACQRELDAAQNMLRRGNRIAWWKWWPWRRPSLSDDEREVWECIVRDITKKIDRLVGLDVQGSDVPASTEAQATDGSQGGGTESFTDVQQATDGRPGGRNSWVRMRLFFKALGRFWRSA